MIARRHPLCLLALTGLTMTSPLRAVEQPEPVAIAAVSDRVVRDIPTDFPHTFTGRHLAKAWAWKRYQYENMGFWQFDPTSPHPGFVYDSKLKEWTMEAIPPEIGDYRFDSNAYEWVPESQNLEGGEEHSVRLNEWPSLGP